GLQEMLYTSGRNRYLHGWNTDNPHPASFRAQQFAMGKRIRKIVKAVVEAEAEACPRSGVGAVCKSTEKKIATLCAIWKLLSSSTKSPTFSKYKPRIHFECAPIAGRQRTSKDWRITSRRSRLMVLSGIFQASVRISPTKSA